MKELLYAIVGLMAKIHEQIMTLNDSYYTLFSDKELHFIVIGFVGMAMFFVIHPIFKLLIRHGHEIVVSWFYVFTLIIVLTFSIEIGQRVTNTGNMEFADIMFGVLGFLFMFAVFALFRLLLLMIIKLFKKE